MKNTGLLKWITGMILFSVLIIACAGPINPPASQPESPDVPVYVAPMANIDSGDFTDKINNPYYPLLPGTRFNIRGRNRGRH